MGLNLEFKFWLQMPYSPIRHSGRVLAGVQSCLPDSGDVIHLIQDQDDGFRAGMTILAALALSYFP